LSAESLARAFVTLLLVATPASADVFRSADIRLQAGGAPGTYELSAVVPGVAATGIEWPTGCTQTELQRQPLADRTRLVYVAACDRSLDRRDVIRTPWQLDAARFTSDLPGVPASRTLLPSAGGIVIPFGATLGRDRSWTEIAPGMLWQGMLHIWSGWDHLAFVLCLCMLCGGWRLLGLVTAFTIGHSVSLGLAFFEVVAVPVAPAEALIALSIVLVAREALLSRDAADQTRPISRAAALVIVFGLVHGLGFASALGALGVTDGERWPALLFFNLGVEVGQVAFVAAVLALMAALRPVALAATARSASLHAAGIIGGFWFVARVASFGVA
jgi:hypothetical protein